MANKLNETQCALLVAAAQRGDHFLTFPEGRPTAAIRQAAKSLVAAGLAREVRARGEAPVWRRDKESDAAFALKLTAVGVKASATLVDPGDAGSGRKPDGRVETPAQKAPSSSRREEQDRIAEQRPASNAAPRSGTKIDHIVKMLSRPEGATLAAIIKATGWLPHTTYAALTGLRKRGYELKRTRDDDVSASVYRLAQPTRMGA